jgi:TonB family protein
MNIFLRLILILYFASPFYLRGAEYSMVESESTSGKTFNSVMAQQQNQIDLERQRTIERMLRQVNSAEKKSSASKSDSPLHSYARKLVSHIRPNIIFTDVVIGNPRAEVELRTGPDGEILSSQLRKPSGSNAWDDAVLKAIQRTGRLPLDENGQVPSHLILGFRLGDSFGDDNIKKLINNIQSKLNYSKEVDKNLYAYVEFNSGEDGNISGFQIKKSSGVTSFDNAVLEAVVEVEKSIATHGYKFPRLFAVMISAESVFEDYLSLFNISCPNIKYPESSLTSREQGLVILRLVINEYLKLGSVKVLASSGFSLLDEAALDLVKKCSFIFKNAEASERVVILPVSFILE